jgi:spore coat polysaccharide biosynthesis predicted glycosyltransferase SpsG
MTNHVLCYAESDSQTGLGHYTRINSFLNLLSKKNKISLVTKNINLAKKIFNQKNLKIIKSPQNIKSFLKKKINKYSHFVLDPPYYDSNKKINSGDYWKFLSKINSNTKIIRLTDEIKPTNHYVDILVNPIPGIEKYKKFYLKNVKKLFLGKNYFFYSKNLFIKKKNKFDLLIAVGGLDPKNVVKKIFFYLKKVNLKKVFICNDFVYSILKKHKNKNNKILKVMNELSFYYYLNSSNFYISSASNIMFEALALKKRGMVISTQSRQCLLGKIFDKELNVVKYVGDYKRLNKKKFFFYLDKIKKLSNVNFVNKNRIQSYKLKIINAFEKK